MLGPFKGDSVDRVFFGGASLFIDLTNVTAEGQSPQKPQTLLKVRTTVTEDGE
jgi:hypothetical protein